MIEREINEIIYSNLNEWVGFDSTSLSLCGGVWKCAVSLTHFIIEIEYDIVKRVYKVLAIDGKSEVRLSKSAKFEREVRRIIKSNGLDMGSFTGHVEAISLLIKERLGTKGKMKSLTGRYWLRAKADGIKIS